MRRVLLALLAAWLAAPTCGTGGPQATVRFEPATVSVAQGSLISTEVVVETDQEVRAWEIDVVSGDPTVALILDVTRHEDFDDDGTLFRHTTFDSVRGEARDAVDLRHGGAAATGSFGIARIYLYAASPGTSTIVIDGGGLSSDAGERIWTTPRTLLVTVTP